MTAIRIGDRVTSTHDERPYSATGAGWDGAMFKAGTYGEVVALPSSVRDVACERCGKRHRTFVCVEFKTQDAKGSFYDRAAIPLCSARRV
jgi:hypothetical protein